MLESLEGVCELLDAGQEGRPYAAALARQRVRTQDPSMLPSTLQLAEMAGSGESFQEYGLRLAREHRAALAKTPLTPGHRAIFASEARASLEVQAAIEASEKGTFDDYLEARLERQTRVS
jgi:glutamate--cysteine ligase